MSSNFGRSERSSGRFKWRETLIAAACGLPLLLWAMGSAEAQQITGSIAGTVNGTAAGAGYSLALAADLCVAARGAKFVNAYHNAGSGHEFGLSYMLPRAVGAQRAAELLRTGKFNVTETAPEVGYSSLSHFSQAFHETFGCCPGLYPLKTPAQKEIR